MTFFTSDLHFGDERMELLKRPFKNASHAASILIENYNKIVSEKDIVFIVGDFAVDKKWLKLAKEMNGKKYLIKGNYDTLDDDDYLEYFEESLNYIDITLKNQDNDIDINELKVRLNHYPSKGVDNRFNICGHIHGSWRVQKNTLNVGVDAHWGLPISSKDVFFYYNAIEKFYDEDVWVSNNKINDKWKERGAKGTYLKKGFKGTLNS